MASAKTVEKTMDILQLISKHPEGLTLTEIYKELDLPKVTVYDILKRLYAQEALYYRDYRQKRYAIGPKMFSIGQAFANNTNFIDPVKVDLEEYANKYNVTVFASTRMKDQIVYTYKAQGPEVRLQTKGIGVQIPVNECPDGKCYLAFENNQSDEELFGEIKSQFYPDDTKDIEEFRVLKEVVYESRKLGYLKDKGTTENFVFALAFPIFNFENKMVGVISTVRLINKLTDEIEKNQIEDLRAIRDKISKQLGYGIRK